MSFEYDGEKPDMDDPDIDYAMRQLHARPVTPQEAAGALRYADRGGGRGSALDAQRDLNEVMAMPDGPIKDMMYGIVRMDSMTSKMAEDLYINGPHN